MPLVNWPVALALFVATPAFAQSQPDFSGRWVLVDPERGSPDIAATLTIRQPVVRTTARGAPMEPAYLRIIIERAFRASTQTDTSSIGAVGGRVSGVRPGQTTPPNTTNFHTRWEENRLVIDTRTVVDGVSTERTEILRYDADGQLEVTLAKRSSGALAVTTTATYRRDRAIALAAASLAGAAQGRCSCCCRQQTRMGSQL